MIDAFTIEVIRSWFMVLFSFYVIICLFGIIRKMRRGKLDWRNRFGIVGLCAGVLSFLLYVVFCGYLWYEHQLVAHGAELWLYYYVGESTAGFGLLGVLGKSGDASESVIISLVMMFQWWRQMVTGVRDGAKVTLLMFILLGVVVICSMGLRLFNNRKQIERF